jgi:hypothetical protein
LDSLNFFIQHKNVFKKFISKNLFQKIYLLK